MENKKKFYSANIPNNWTIPIVNDNQIVTIFLLIIGKKANYIFQELEIITYKYSKYAKKQIQTMVQNGSY
jgi:hypothetical protein